jgi:serine/threonine-protein kinase
MPQALKIVIADDAVLTRAGIAGLLREHGHDVVGEAGDPDTLLELVEIHHPDTVVVDIRMPPTHTTEGIEAAGAIRKSYPGTGVLLLSNYVETDHAVHLLQTNDGFIGYLLKERVGDVADFMNAVERVAAGGTALDPSLVRQIMDRKHRTPRPQDSLTDREREVLTLMAQGMSNRAISASMFLADRTVETHIKAIFSKLGLPSEADSNRRVLAVLMHLRATEDSA